jgi:hypothetical protein
MPTLNTVRPRFLIAILLVQWATVAAPALCQGGLLEHLCAPHPASDCEHETSCGDDPCTPMIRPDEDQRSIVADAAPRELEIWRLGDLVIWRFQDGRTATGPPHHQTTRSPSHQIINLPVHRSDIPLLI